MRPPGEPAFVSRFQVIISVIVVVTVAALALTLTSWHGNGVSNVHDVSQHLHAHHQQHQQHQHQPQHDQTNSALFLNLIFKIVAGFERTGFPLDPKPGKPNNFRTDVYTLLSTYRLQNLEALVRSLAAERVEGDIAETGVWRGGAMMYVQAVMLTLGETERRRLWLCDSFRGIPPVNIDMYPADNVHARHLEEVDTTFEGGASVVNDTFKRFGLWRPNLRWVVGWFNESLPVAPIRRLALLRMDGDLFESTLDALVNLYPKVVDGGFVIVDDYPLWRGCVLAVDLFRRVLGITDPIHLTGPREMYALYTWNGTETGIYWRKTARGRGRHVDRALIAEIRREARALPKETTPH
jgi:hypothetical protein